jgi:hypothetical protein
VALDQAHAGGLPNRSLIGSGPELSEQVVMVVDLEDSRPESAGDDPSATPPNTYWRAVSYDVYTGRGWETGETQVVTYAPGELALFPSEEEVGSERQEKPPGRQVLRQEVQKMQDLGGLMYRAGELLTADSEFRGAWRSPDDLFGAEIDVQAYRVDALVSTVSEAQLRTASDVYPDWVKDRYLALPPEVSSRVRSLAEQLTSSQPTGYDRARAIESYVRAFTYTLDLPAPPPGREVADYFLFDLKQGYCDYYATSMAVLARAAGLPSRLVVGYIGGDYDPMTGRYTVVAADAHSWVEIYFPDYGWIEFEPTGGRPSIERAAQAPSSGISEPTTPLEPRGHDRFEFGEYAWRALVGGLIILLVLGAGWWVLDGLRLRRLSPEEAIQELYRRFYRLGRRLLVSTEAGDTPHEFSAATAERIAVLVQARQSGQELDSTLHRIAELTDLYVRGRYSLSRPNAREKRKAIHSWQRLRRFLWRAWIWHKRDGRTGSS